MGTLIDIGGRRLWMDVAGAGQPTIILEAGGACASDTWQPVWQELTQMTRVCRYDRAGLGRSDPVPTPRTAAALVADLHAILERAALAPPYLLVGHSFGGLIACVYAHRYPAAVAGLVLLDPTPPDPVGRWRAVLPPATPTDSPTIRSLRDWVTTQCHDPLWNDERVDQAQSFREFQEVASLGALPMTLLHAGMPPWNDDPALPVPLATTLTQTLRAMATDVLHLSSHSQLIDAPTSGHFIHTDQPALVVETIRACVQHGRGQAT